jgi:hypothetical protein
MTISRRSLFTAVAGAIAGATVLRQAVAATVESAAVTEYHKYTVETICDDDPSSPFITYTRIATEDKDYRMQRLRDEWRRMHVGPRNVTTLPDGWGMRQHAPYKAADGQPAVFWDHA